MITGTDMNVHRRAIYRIYKYIYHHRRTFLFSAARAWYVKKKQVGNPPLVWRDSTLGF